MPYTITLNLPTSGLTLTAKVMSGAVVEHSQSMPELTVSGVSGRYAATISAGPTDGTYDVLAVSASGKVYGAARVSLAGGSEVNGFADVRYVNGIKIDGTGQDNDPWGPV